MLYKKIDNLKLEVIESLQDIECFFTVDNKKVSDMQLIKKMFGEEISIREDSEYEQDDFVVQFDIGIDEDGYKNKFTYLNEKKLNIFYKGTKISEVLLKYDKYAVGELHKVVKSRLVLVVDEIKECIKNSGIHYIVPICLED